MPSRLGISKNGERRAHYTATAEVEEEHVNRYGIKRKVIVKRGRFLIGQYLDRSKYNGDGSKKDVAVQN